MTSLVRI